MSYTHRVRFQWTSSAGEQIEDTVSRTADGADRRTLTLVDTTDGQPIAISWTNAQLKLLFILSDADVTLFSNVDGGAGNDTVHLKANEPVVYWAGVGQVNPFATANVAILYGDNFSGGTATVEICVLVDATP